MHSEVGTAVGENIGPLQWAAPPTVGRVKTPPAALPNKAAIFSIFQGDRSGALPSHARKRATRRQFPSSCDLTRAKTPPPKASPSSQLPLPISPHLQLLQLRRQRCPTRHRQLKFDGESDPTLIFQSLLQSLLLDAASPDSLCCCCFSSSFRRSSPDNQRQYPPPESLQPVFVRHHHHTINTLCVPALAPDGDGEEPNHVLTFHLQGD